MQSLEAGADLGFQNGGYGGDCVFRSFATF